jgi:hypothetical protein
MNPVHVSYMYFPKHESTCITNMERSQHVHTVFYVHVTPMCVSDSSDTYGSSCVASLFEANVRIHVGFVGTNDMVPIHV